MANIPSPNGTMTAWGGGCRDEKQVAGAAWESSGTHGLWLSCAPARGASGHFYRAVKGAKLFQIDLFMWQIVYQSRTLPGGSARLGAGAQVSISIGSLRGAFPCCVRPQLDTHRVTWRPDLAGQV